MRYRSDAHLIDIAHFSEMSSTSWNIACSRSER
jgi:hypothetical protein